MPAGIFISYRRDESRHAAGRLADDLSQVFGAAAIFRDIEGIDPGVDFTQSLERALESCVVMLVLIGPQWLDMRDPQGKRRLENPDDWIRQEIATALARDVRVVPVLLEGAQMPDESALSEDLHALVRRQALDMSDMRWRGDLQRLVEALEKVPGVQRQEPTPVPAPPAPTPMPIPPPPDKGSRKSLFIGIGLGVVGLLVVAGLFSEEEDPGGFAPESAMTAPAPRGGFDAQPAGGLPNIAGLWRTNSGETYRFELEGREVFITALVGGQPAGEGHGEFDGHLLRLALTLRPQGQPIGTNNCNLEVAPNGQSFTGLCNGPGGSFPAQLFR